MGMEMKDFRNQLRKEADRLLSTIKGESDLNRKYQLCGVLLEIYEELDIEAENNSPLWFDMQITYQEFIHYILDTSPKTA